MFAARYRDFGEVLARRAVQIHVALRPEGVRGDRTEIAVSRPELLREEARWLSFIEDAILLTAVRAR